jgi:hypothetical protein
MVPPSEIPPGERLHVKLASAPEIGWIDAQVVHVVRGRGAGIRFCSHRSSKFVRAALSGGNPWFENCRDDDTPAIEKRSRGLALR